MQEPYLPKPVSRIKVPAYDNAVEVTDIQALDDLVMDPDAMRMMALLVRERILGPAHPDTSYYIRYRGAIYADTGRFDRCIELWTYALTMQQQVNVYSYLDTLFIIILLAKENLNKFLSCSKSLRVIGSGISQSHDTKFSTQFC